MTSKDGGRRIGNGYLGIFRRRIRPVQPRVPVVYRRDERRAPSPFLQYPSAEITALTCPLTAVVHPAAQFRKMRHASGLATASIVATNPLEGLQHDD
jgi:hypothetical protein